jgi:hypothetical protein
VTVGNVATGFTDEDFAVLTERFEPLIAAQAGQQVELEPAVVFEVGYEEIQASPTYGSGYALRFPRFVAVREDKAPADADRLERVEALAAGEASGGSANKGRRDRNLLIGREVGLDVLGIEVHVDVGRLAAAVERHGTDREDGEQEHGQEAAARLVVLDVDRASLDRGVAAAHRPRPELRAV